MRFPITDLLVKSGRIYLCTTADAIMWINEIQSAGLRTEMLKFDWLHLWCDGNPKPLLAGDPV